MTLSEEIDQLDKEQKRLDERRKAIYRKSLQAPETEKVCDDWLAMSHYKRPNLFPMEVKGIHYEGWDEEPVRESLRGQGQFVAVRVAGQQETHLGVLIGDMARAGAVSFNRETGVLCIRRGFYNPAIWVPALNRVVWGCESWWSPIESEDQLRDITDEHINNTWYVKALSVVFDKKEEATTEEVE